MLEWRDLYQLTKDGQSESEENLPGMVRGPTNLMRGVRSAWTAACRRTREVRSILIVGGGFFLEFCREWTVGVGLFGSDVEEWKKLSW